MSPFPILVGVANKLEKIQRDIQWGGLSDDFKFHLVKWQKICTLIKSG
jgi:hypothetical protein